jgi:ABC-type phosphate transport system substrate-binding protein
MKKVSIYVFLLSMVWGANYCWAERIAVIVNRANPVDDLSTAKLARIYKGKQQKWPDGRQIVVVNRPVNSAIRKVFYQKVLNGKPNQKFYVTGSPIPFRSIIQCSSLATMRFINNMPEAIGYIYLNELETDKSNRNIKLVGVIEPENNHTQADNPNLLNRGVK